MIIGTIGLKYADVVVEVEEDDGLGPAVESEERVAAKWGDSCFSRLARHIGVRVVVAFVFVFVEEEEDCG
jgi:hypothetical protein